MFYFTGTVQNSFLYIPADGEPILMVKGGLQRALEESPLKNIVPIKSPKQIPEMLSSYGYKANTRIGMELDVIPFNIYKTYKEVFSQVELYDVSPLVKEIRAVKSPYEIELLKKATSVIDEAFLSVPSFLKEGM